MKAYTDSFALACKLVKIALNVKPQIIHSHRYKENILAVTAAPFVCFPRLVTTLHGKSEVKSNPALKDSVNNKQVADEKMFFKGCSRFKRSS